MNETRKLSVLVVDDHDVVHWGFRLLLSEQPWVKRCLTARDHDEAMALTARYEPDVALVDLFLGEHSGAELCTSITTEHPSTRVLLISGAGWISPQAARAAGASGFVSKDSSADVVTAAVKTVGAGNLVFPRSPREPSAPLSPREREVLTLMAAGVHQPRDRRPAAPVAAHGQGAHQRALPQARRAQPGRGRAPRGAAGPQRVAGSRPATRSIHAASAGRPSALWCSSRMRWNSSSSAGSRPQAYFTNG